MEIKDNKSRKSFRQQMIIRLPEKPEYEQFVNLMEDDYEIVIARDTDDLYEILDGPRERVACIAIDAVTAIRDDFRFHRKISTDMRFVAIPTIALTTEASAADCTRCISEGMSEYIELPELEPVIRQRVNNAIRSKDSATFAEIEQMLKQLPSNIYLKDAEGKYVFATHYWHHLRQADDPDWTIRGKTDLEIRKDKDNARLALESDIRMLQTGEGTSYIIEENEDGVREFLELIKRPVYDKNGKISGIIALINDVTEFQLLKMELEKRSRVDPLTGLLNKSTAEELISMAVTNSARNRGKAALLMIDVDNFKGINDTFGHAIGDQVLSKIGRIIKDNFKGMDICGRFGGDEFMVLLREIDDASTALLLGEHLNMLLAEESRGEVYEDAVTLSIGIAMFPQHGTTYRKLFLAADKALYHVKNNGKAGQYVLPEDVSDETDQ